MASTRPLCTSSTTARASCASMSTRFLATRSPLTKRASCARSSTTRTRRSSWSAASARIRPPGTKRCLTSSSWSLVRFQAATPAPRFVRPSHAITPTSSTSCYTRIRMRTTIVCAITSASWSPSWRPQAPTTLSSRSPRSSSAWPSTTCTWWATSSTAAAALPRLWTACSPTIHSTSSGATTTCCGWALRPVSPPASQRCCATTYATTITRSWRTTTASRCASLLPLPMPPTPPVSPSPR